MHYMIKIVWAHTGVALRGISVADPGCLSDPDFFPSRIPDPKTKKRRGTKICSFHHLHDIFTTPSSGEGVLKVCKKYVNARPRWLEVSLPFFADFFTRILFRRFLRFVSKIFLC